MVALLDVNFLVALFDADHQQHSAAREWLKSNRHHGWATCPFTETGFARTLSRPNYPHRVDVSEAVNGLSRLRQIEGHSFWPSSLSLCASERIKARNITGHNQLTDVYLLALAVDNGGRLATFDQGISLAAVNGARTEHLVCLSAP